MVRSPSLRPLALGSLAALAALAIGASPASAQNPLCTSLPNPVIGIGGSAQTPMLKSIARALLASSSPNPITLIYKNQGACFGINALLDNASPITGTATYWSAADNMDRTCDFPVTGVQADFGVMGNTSIQCAGITEHPEYVADVLGPIGTINIFVHKDSTQTSISTEALHFIYGYGQNSHVSPWNSATPGHFVRRNATSFAQIFIALAADLSPTFTVGVDALTNQASVNLVATGDPQASIGFASGDTIDTTVAGVPNRSIVRTLAYQHTGQTCGYLPDSSPSSFDKENVRNGQYYLWAPAHFYARVDQGTGEYESAGAGTLLGYIDGSVPTPSDVNLLDIFIDSHQVPQCAMRAGRDGDLGPIFSYQPENSCGCYFDNRVSGSTTCQTCETSAECPAEAPVCSYGYCEVN